LIFIGIPHEFGIVSVDCDLDFAVDEIVKLGINHDAVGSLSVSIFYFDDFEHVGNLECSFFADPQNLRHFF
jgi:hypothetical protein